MKQLVERTREHPLRHTISELLSSHLDLAQGCFSNNVAQHLVTHYESKGLIAAMQAHFPAVATHKFGSYVVERCIWHERKEVAESFLELLLGPGCLRSCPASLAPRW